jgi:hypothetical protein
LKVIAAGKGLYLSAWKKGSSVTASGMYLKTGNGYIDVYADGEGLLFGFDSPFKNRPILNWSL